MTGIEVTLNVLAEFIGGIWVQGNAVSFLGPTTDICGTDYDDSWP